MVDKMKTCKECFFGRCEVWLYGNGNYDVYFYCDKINKKINPNNDTACEKFMEVKTK